MNITHHNYTKSQHYYRHGSGWRSIYVTVFHIIGKYMLLPVMCNVDGAEGHHFATLIVILFSTYNNSMWNIYDNSRMLHCCTDILIFMIVSAYRQTDNMFNSSITTLIVNLPLVDNNFSIQFEKNIQGRVCTRNPLRIYSTLSFKHDTVCYKVLSFSEITNLELLNIGRVTGCHCKTGCDHYWLKNQCTADNNLGHSKFSLSF